MTCTTALVLAMLTVNAGRAGIGPREAPGDPNGLITRALELRRAGRPADALGLFRQAHEQAPSPRTLGHLGLVETSLHLWSDADAHLAAAMATPADGWIRRNQAFLVEARARTAAHVGQLLVTGPPGARLAISGKAVGRLPLAAPLRLAEGDVRISATADGHKPFSIELNIQGGTRAAITVVLEPLNLNAAPPVPPAGPAAPDRPWHVDRRKWVGAALTGAGIGTLALGIIWLNMDGRCETFLGRPRGCLSAYDTAGLGWLATVGGAAMLMAGGIVLYVGSRPGTAVGVAAGPRSLRLEARF
ncbi:MAG TPA: hypothetical protein VN962_10115 [Polyangia bacterium]|nr:hypothetical protein [Polyangia bacterium]